MLHLTTKSERLIARCGLISQPYSPRFSMTAADADFCVMANLVNQLKFEMELANAEIKSLRLRLIKAGLSAAPTSWDRSS